MKSHIITIRRLLAASALLVSAVILAILYARFIEPTWVTVNSRTLSKDPTTSLIHISDIHYKGDRKYLKKVVGIINKTDADFVCITGDLVEDRKWLAPCMDILGEINKPVYGIPGNHDQWARVDNNYLAHRFAETGGAWLLNGAQTTVSNKVIITGEAVETVQHPHNPALKTILLHHYPRIVDQLPPKSYDLILAGHTHGGQVRLPFIRNTIIDEADLKYIHGFFFTPAGIMHVSSGIGTYYLPLRFMCRPEITIIKF